MYNFSSKYSIGGTNQFNKAKPFSNIQFGIVTTVGKVDVNLDSEKNKSNDVRFNSDEHSIRCRIIGSSYDNKYSDSELPNCFPLLPKHLNFVPKINEVVMVILLGEDDRYSDRFYIGPITSSLSKLNIDTIDTTALSNFSIGNTTPSPQISKITTAKGVYSDPQDVTIQGRSNTDIIQKDNEIILRAGKSVLNEPLIFNKKNPAYIQLKFNQTIKDSNGNSKQISVNNIVANKINLLTYDGGNPVFNNLTNVDTSTNKANYITDKQLNEILETAHPLVFGDTLVKYLKLLKSALLNHVHNGNGNIPTDRTDKDNTTQVADFIKNAELLEKEMISSNIKIN